MADLSSDKKERILRDHLPCVFFLLAISPLAALLTASVTFLLFSTMARSLSVNLFTKGTETPGGVLGLFTSATAREYFLDQSAFIPIVRITSSPKFADFAKASISPSVSLGLSRTAREICLFDSLIRSPRASLAPRMASRIFCGVVIRWTCCIMFSFFFSFLDAADEIGR